jgi:hypothetical protein
MRCTVEREADPLRDLAEAQARCFVLERMQDRGRARDHLHLALFRRLLRGNVLVHRLIRPWQVFAPWQPSSHDDTEGPIYDTTRISRKRPPQ